VQSRQILSFLSYCGGLPAPEASGNPLGYKFSWSPRGVLLALRNPAKFLENGKVSNRSIPFQTKPIPYQEFILFFFAFPFFAGWINKVVEIPGPQLLNSAKPIYILPGFAVEGYANRDSTPYDVRYKIPEAHTILRGTLRYQGFPQFMQALVDLGFLDDMENPKLVPGAAPISWVSDFCFHFFFFLNSPCYYIFSNQFVIRKN
jgi:saccharopine dehydrogenase (NADP+, L-glutamate forming)